MKGLVVLIITVLINCAAFAQADLNAITSLMDQPRKKIENYLHRKGFTRENDLASQELLFSKKSLENNNPVARSFQLVYQKEDFRLVYKSTSSGEHSKWKRALLADAHPFSSKDSTGLYYDPKNNITFHCMEERVDTAIVYTLSANKKSLPKIKELIYAEDLLNVEAHVYLEAVFGKQNVKEDHFYFSETQKKKCSIIYPNTNRQAIFIWNDEQNLKDVLFIIIGEYENKSTDGSFTPLSLAQWRSKQGISCGMSLRELERANQQEINFHKWRSPMAGTLAENKGSINFNSIEIILDCMNCSFVPSGSNAMVISSADATEQNQKWYVRSFAVIKSKVPGE